MTYYSLIEELDDKEWISDLTSSVDVTFRLKCRNKGLKGKKQAHCRQILQHKGFQIEASIVGKINQITQPCSLSTPEAP